MSLMNETLKSIQKKSINTSDIIPMPAVLLSTNAFKIKIPLLIIVIMSSFCIITLFLTAIFQHQSTMPLHYFNFEETIINKSNINAITSRYLGNTQIKEVSVNIKENMTDIHLSLNHPVLYYLSTDTFSNTLTLFIPNASLQTTIPEIDALNTGIVSIDYQNTKEGLKINLTLLPQTTLEALSLNEETKYPELLLTLNNHHQPLRIEQPKVSEAIITPSRIETIDEKYNALLQETTSVNKEKTFELLKQFTLNYPSYDKARLAYVALLINNKQLKEAVINLNVGLQLNPHHLPYVELMARVHEESNHLDLAIQLLEKYSPNINKHPRFYSLLAALYQKNEQPKQAASIYKELLSLDSDNQSWWIGLGQSLQRLRSIPEAKAAYRQALALNQFDPTMDDFLTNQLSSLEEVA